MREITPEIKAKLELKANQALQNGNALLVIDPIEFKAYYSLLCELYKNNEIEAE